MCFFFVVSRQGPMLQHRAQGAKEAVQSSIHHGTLAHRHKSMAPFAVKSQPESSGGVRDGGKSRLVPIAPRRRARVTGFKPLFRDASAQARQCVPHQRAFDLPLKGLACVLELASSTGAIPGT